MPAKDILKEGALIAAVVLVAAAATFYVHPKAPALYLQSSPVENEITLDELRRLGGKVIWIDARTEKAFAKDHVEGAFLLNQEYWADLLWKHHDVIDGIEGTPVVVYCDGSRCRRSSEIAERLRTELGLSPVYVFKGDWWEW